MENNIEHYRELAKKIEKREKIVDALFYISIWGWLLAWVIWVQPKMLANSDNPFVAFIVGILILVVVDFIIMSVALWVHKNIGKTVK